LQLLSSEQYEQKSGPRAPVPVAYKGQRVGNYYAGILVEDALVVELRCADNLNNDHVAQGLNYRRAANLNLCLLLNFQKPKVEWRRIIF